MLKRTLGKKTAGRPNGPEAASAPRRLGSAGMYPTPFLA
jgi:hypothetical protein